MRRNMLLILVVATSSVNVSFSQMFHPFQDSTSSLFGFKNKAGDVMIKPQFIHAFEQQYRHLLFGVTDSGWIAINHKGEYLFTAYTYDNGPDYFSNGLMRITQNNLIGYANKKGIIVIQPIYAYAEPFKKGMAIVSQVPRHIEHDPKKYYRDTYDVINKRGRIVWGKHDKYNLLRETPKK